MKKVQFWQIGDTVVSRQEPAKTWVVTDIKNTGNLDILDWARIESLNAQNTITGNVRYLQSMGFVGYRKVADDPSL